MEPSPRLPSDDGSAAPTAPTAARQQGPPPASRSAGVAVPPSPAAPGPPAVPPMPPAVRPILAYRPPEEWDDPADRPLHPVMRFLVAGRWVWLGLYAAGVLG